MTISNTKTGLVVFIILSATTLVATIIVYYAAGFLAAWL
jgi:hypothetical protein